MKILAIDENQDNLSALKTVMQGVLPQARILTSLPDEEGLAFARQDPPDIILIETIMSGIDAFDLCRKLKDDEHLKLIPVVFLTPVNPSPDLRLRALEAGGTALLPKPNVASELRAHAIPPGTPYEDQQHGSLLNESLLQALPFPVEIVDSQGVILFANTRLCMAVGRQVAGERCWLVNRDNARQCTHCPLQFPIEIGKTCTVENGDVLQGVTCEISHTGILYRGRPAVMVIFLDITSRKQSEAEREQFMAAIQQSSESIVITGTDGVIQFVNLAFEKTTGYTRQEAIGKTPGILKSGLHDKTFYATLWSALTGGRTWSGRITNKRKDGSLFTEAATISPVRDDSGRIVNYVAIKRDITQHLLLEDRLLQAQKMESVGRLAGGIAHDFNNMLQAILGYTEMALKKADPGSSLHDDLAEILKAAHRSSDLTRQLLTFSRQQRIEPRILDINEVIASLLKMLRRLIGENIELTWSPGKGPLTVRMDPAQVTQILTNLAINANDAVSGAGSLVIETRDCAIVEHYTGDHMEATPGAYVVLSVADNGCGMEPHVLKHIFEPFFTTKGVGKGTGLGLATVYGITRQNGGFIEVRSQPGKGTTFQVYLPACPAPGITAQPTPKPSSRPRGTETILLVEDERGVRRIAQTLLEECGYKVLVAEAPDMALRLASDNPGIHLLLTDMVMPQMGGDELARILIQSDPRLKCLFMSGYTGSDFGEELASKTDKAFLPKPFTRDMLARKVRQVLDGE